MKLSVVIPTCDRLDKLRDCLLQLRLDTQTYSSCEYEIVVSDDGRNQSAAEALSGEFPDVIWLEGPRRGPAANRNAGAALACGEVVVFLDDDCLPQRDLLAVYARGFADPGVMAAEGRIRADRKSLRMDEESPLNEFGGCFWSCNIAIRREYFFKIGGFDERFPRAAMEDVELRERIIRLGPPIVFLPEALVVHPFRRARGWSAVRSRAEGHAVYILIPGCHLSPPSYLGALRATGIIFSRRFLPRFIALRGRGSWRAFQGLALPLLSAWCMKKALRTARREEAANK